MRFPFPFCRRFRGGKCPTGFSVNLESFLPISPAWTRQPVATKLLDFFVSKNCRGVLGARTPGKSARNEKMTNPADATQVDIAEKENAPSPAVKASPKPAANGDGSSKFVNVDGKVKHRGVVKADGVDAVTHADATVGAEQEPANDYERQREVRDFRRYSERFDTQPPRVPFDPHRSLSHPRTHPSTLHPGTHPSQQRAAQSAQGARHREGARGVRGRRLERRRRRQRRQATALGPRRQTQGAAAAARAKSRRLAAVANADAALAAKLQTAEDDGGFADDDDDDDATPAHLTCEEWCEKRGLVPGPKMDGRFRGWVAPDLVESLGLAASAAEAWREQRRRVVRQGGQGRQGRKRQGVCP